MSSYGHPQSSEYEGHDAYSQYEDTYAMDSYGRDPYPQDPYAREPARGAARAAASVGSAGRARVAPPSPTPSVSPPRVSPASPEGEQPVPRYDWSKGGRSSGRATVPVSPAGPVKGRAAVQPGGPGGPGGPTGTGPRGTGPGRPAKKKKRHWFRNTVLIMLAVSVITIGGGMVALSYYVDSVPAPQDLPLAQGSTIYFANGDEMATLQEVNREIIDTRVPELANVRNAVVAAEDKNFYEHSGVDFMGIVRAAFTNTTGSADRSGASTIDMQYTRAAAGLNEDSYTRKLREAAMAYKLNQEHEKSEILDFYLNQIYLGRGAYGVEAAAQAYFDKPAAELSAAEAALLAGIIRNPASDGETGLSPYDPWHEANAENPQVALDRWGYVLDQMVDTGTLPAAERAQLVELPETVEPQDPDEPLKGNQGMIVKQIQYELERMGIDDVETGGYRITTTIDREVQRAAIDAARRTGDAPYWDTVEDNIRSALVAVDPATGGVIAYWGGTTDGTGIDLAGPNRREDGVWYGGRPPGSTAKIYTLIAEMRRGVSFDSHWETSEYTPDWAPSITVRNAGRNADVGGCEGQAPDHCTLRWVTQQSYNVSFARFAERVPDGQGPAEILDAAMDAGVTMMTDTADGTPHQLAELDLADTREFFDMPIAYGQYPITALDHANGVATLANHGMYNRAHFVDTVEVRVDGEWQETNGARINGEQRIEAAHADAITGVLSTIPGIWGFPLEGGRPAAAKTGTWEHIGEGNVIDGNADAWVVGYTPQIAAAVWVGDPLGAKIEDVYGGAIGSSGLPANIWRQFMNAAHAAKEYDFAQFPPAPPVGDQQSPLSNGPPPPEEPDEDCRLPFFCDDDDEDNGGGNQGGGQIVPPGDGGDTDEGGGG
jgi:membrane peptidoglycan carboxypeptidase